MNTYLRFLRKEEAHSVYKAWLKHHFPRDELKPWSSIARMWDRDCYFAVGVFEDTGDVPTNASDDLSALRGYAFFVEVPDCEGCLLDYYAILPEFRDAGLGGRTLQRLAELCRGRGKYILIETEDIDCAKTDAEKTERLRRDSFYERNGCRKTDVRGTVFTAKYAVWHLGADGRSFDCICDDMNTLYRTMVPGEKNKLFVKIRRV